MKKSPIIDEHVRNKGITLPSVDQFAQYLIRTGWTRIKQDNTKILVFGTQDSGYDGSESPILIFPSEDSYSDTKLRISDALYAVAAFCGKQFTDILAEVFCCDYDVLRLRIKAAEMRGIPLKLMPKLLQGYGELISQSAQLESYKYGERPYCLGKSSKTIQTGTEIAGKCLFGHTFAGSFGISIEMPLKLDPNQFSDVSRHAVTLERLTMQRIAVGLADAANALQKEQVSIITDNLENGFNADLCQTMGALMSMLSHIEESPRIEYLFDWSPLIIPAKHGMLMEPIVFTPAEIVPVFQHAAKEMRALQNAAQVTLKGEIVMLADDPEKKETDESRRRTITIRCKDKPNIKDVKITLVTEEDYATACMVRARKNWISVRGILCEEGKIHRLRNPKNCREINSHSLFREATQSE